MSVMSPQAGTMTRRLMVEWNDDSARDEAGAPVPEWRLYAMRWGQVEPLSGREFLQAQQIDSEVSVRITMRHIKGLTSKMRFVDVRDGQRMIYEIGSIVDFGSLHRKTECLCKAGRQEPSPRPGPAGHSYSPFRTAGGG